MKKAATRGAAGGDLVATAPHVERHAGLDMLAGLARAQMPQTRRAGESAGDAEVKGNGSRRQEWPSEPVVAAYMEESAVRAKTCNCRNTKCLKLYCECFASAGYCGPRCHCINCLNRPETERQRKHAVEAALSRNPHAFRPKIPPAASAAHASSGLGGVGTKRQRGCNCRKSGCLKKYCECFQAGVVCSVVCSCSPCHNYASSPYLVSARRSELRRDQVRDLVDQANKATNLAPVPRVPVPEVQEHKEEDAVERHRVSMPAEEKTTTTKDETEATEQDDLERDRCAVRAGVISLAEVERDCLFLLRVAEEERRLVEARASNGVNGAHGTRDDPLFCEETDVDDVDGGYAVVERAIVEHCTAILQRYRRRMLGSG